MKLRRINAGYYETLDGKYEIVGFQRTENIGYGPVGSMVWYWRERPYGSVEDNFDTKREAVESLQRWLSRLAAYYPTSGEPPRRLYVTNLDSADHLRRVEILGSRCPQCNS